MKISPAEHARFRALWESDPDMTYVDIANISGLSKQAIGRRAKREKWKKRTTSAAITKVAHDKATIGDNEALAGTLVPADSSVGEAIADALADVKAEIIARHRREWNGTRNKIYGALQSSDFEKAKLGKITSEALSIIQAGERKAWGLDSDKAPNEMKLIIQRGD